MPDPAALSLEALPPPRSAPRPGGPTDPSHDEELRRGIIHTAISRPLAIALVGVFLLGIYAVPIAQALLEKVRDEEPMLLDVFKRAPTKESLKRYEDDLEKASYAKEFVQPRVQLLLTRLGGVGNKRAVVGRGGWLFYAPGVQALAGPGFLDRGGMAVRRKAAADEGDEALYPDPRPAVLDFARALARRGIRLVLFPVPDKAALQPRELHGRADAGRGPLPVAANPDLARFVAELRAAGVAVFDAAPATLAAGEPPRFLVQDTHWTPAWMEAVAASLARLVRETVDLPAPAAPPALKTKLMTIARVGDIVDMLKLPEGQALFAPQTVTLRQVQDDKGEPWQPKESADVLLLGDSFTNVFTLGQMGWGEAAGLAPHLSAALGRDVDVIAQNDSGAFATRKLLSEALAAGEDRLAGKRVVIWELASRELAVGNFKPYRYEVGKPR
jgi:alginate O-acetyltransferase complex protein AlgJ